MATLNSIAYQPTYVNLKEACDINELVEWHDRFKKRLKGDGADQLDNPWLATQPCNNGDWMISFRMRFGGVVEHIKSLPFDEILRVSIIESTEAVAPHQDLSRDSVSVEPSSYRCFLLTDNKFWLAPALESEQTGTPKRITRDPHYKYYPKPDLGQWWVMNNHNSIHGCDANTVPNSRKIIVSIWGSVNPVEHMKLLKNSVSHSRGITWQL